MTEVSFSTHLSSFTEKAARLNAASDSLNKVLLDVEKRLVDSNVGIEVWLRHAVGATVQEVLPSGEISWTAKFLGFARVDSHWCLAVRPVRFVSGFFEGDTSCPYQNEYGDGDPTRLLRASRELRIAALERLPTLIELLGEAAERAAQTINDARATLK